MKFKGSIKIEKPRDKVVSDFIDPKYLGKYQDGFIKKELVSGEQAKDGAISKMYYRHGKYDIVLTETIIANRLPDSFESSYYHKYMDNTMKCYFIVLVNGSTRFEYDFEYTRINWFIPKLISILFPSFYKNKLKNGSVNLKNL